VADLESSGNSEFGSAKRRLECAAPPDLPSWVLLLCRIFRELAERSRNLRTQTARLQPSAFLPSLEP
jgi:hypothetical protein